MKRFAIIAVLIAAGIVGWLYWRQSRPVPLVVSGFIESDEIRVGSRVGGRVSAIKAAEGDRVKPGDPLFQIDPFDLNEMLAEANAKLAADEADLARLKKGFRTEEIEQARAKRDRAVAELEKAIAGPRPREIEIARERVKAAQADLDLARSEHERVMSLKREDNAARIEIDRAVRALRSAEAESAGAQQQLELLEEGTRKEDLAQARAIVAEAGQALKLLEAGYRPEDVARAEAQVRAARASVQAIQERLDELTVVSPRDCHDCRVEAIDLRPGDLVAANAPTVSLVDLSRLWVRAYVPESHLGRVQIGMRVPITVDSFPGRRFMGRVTFISREGEFTPRNIQTPEERSKQVFRIKVTLDEGLDVLRVGMPADVHLDQAAAA